MRWVDSFRFTLKTEGLEGLGAVITNLTNFERLSPAQNLTAKPALTFELRVLLKI